MGESCQLGRGVWCFGAGKGGSGGRPWLLSYPGDLCEFQTYLATDLAKSRVPLAQAWAVPLEQAFPLAGSRPGKGQRHLSGLCWWDANQWSAVC